MTTTETGQSSPPLDRKLLLYSLADAMDRTLGIVLCDNTKEYLGRYKKKFIQLEQSKKIYYSSYGLNLAKSLTEYFKQVSNFELNVDSDHEIDHDFRLTYFKKHTAYVSMSHYGINTRNIIPEKLMKICRYKKNTNICKEYSAQYKKICIKAFKKLQNKKKYSAVNEKTKRATLMTPICQLVVDTIGKKRKCAQCLYQYMFAEEDRVVLKLYKNRFKMYDFGIDLPAVEGFKMKLVAENRIQITFNNGSQFQMTLHTNSSDIKKHISLKFHNTFKNMDDLYGVGGNTVTSA
jgi:hypothetical protein